MPNEIQNSDVLKLDFTDLKSYQAYIALEDLSYLRQFYPIEARNFSVAPIPQTSQQLVWIFTEFLKTTAIVQTGEELAQIVREIITQYKNNYPFFMYWKFVENSNNTDNAYTLPDLNTLLKNAGILGSIGNGNGNQTWMYVGFEKLEILPYIDKQLTVQQIDKQRLEIPQFVRQSAMSVTLSTNTTAILNGTSPNMVLYKSKPINKVVVIHHITQACGWNTRKRKCSNQLLGCNGICHTKKTQDFINIKTNYVVHSYIYPAGLLGLKLSERNFYLSFLELFSKAQFGDVILLNESVKNINNRYGIDYPFTFNEAINDMINYLATQKVAVVLCAGNRKENLDLQSYQSPTKREAIVVGAIKKANNGEWIFDSNYSDNANRGVRPSIDFYVQTHHDITLPDKSTYKVFSQSSAASAYIAYKIKTMQDTKIKLDGRKSYDNVLSVQTIKQWLTQEAQSIIVNGISIHYFPTSPPDISLTA